jgi:hypothetical protein
MLFGGSPQLSFCKHGIFAPDLTPKQPFGPHFQPQFEAKWDGNPDLLRKDACLEYPILPPEKSQLLIEEKNASHKHHYGKQNVSLYYSP